jgi:hypothetical protein
MASLRRIAVIGVILLFVFSAGARGQTVGSVVTPMPIPATFFGVSVAYLTVTGSWPLNISVGTLGKTQGTEWNDVEPSNGTYNWAPLDATISQAKSAGITSFMYTFWSTPEWASSNPSQSCILTAIENVTGCAAPPTSINDWDSFVKAVVTRYSDQIRYFELWNEPNLDETFSGSVAQMVTMSQHAYADIKAIDPSAIVLSPAASRVGVLQYSPGCNVAECWLAEYFAAGGGAYANAVAFHPYACLDNDSACAKLGIGCPQGDIQACAGTPLTTEVSDIRAIMAAYGLSKLPLIATEGGFPSDIISQDGLGSSDQQTAFVARWFMLQASENVSTAVWFSEFHPENGLLGFGTTGALSEINQGYEQTYRWLVGSTFEGPCSLSAGIWACDLTLSNGASGQIVFADSSTAPVPYSPPSGFTEYQNLNASIYPLGSSVGVGMEPILLTSSALASSSAATSTAASTSSVTTVATTQATSASVTSNTSSASVAASSSFFLSAMVQLALVATTIISVVAASSWRREKPRG